MNKVGEAPVAVQGKGAVTPPPGMTVKEMNRRAEEASAARARARERGEQ